MHLYLIRHGQSHVNLADWNNGNTDEGLTELGQAQAVALAEFFPQEVPTVDTIYASTMRRARETAGFLAEAYGAEIVLDDRLREIGNNRLDHTAWPNDALPTEYADFWGSERPFATVTPVVEKGETFIHFRARVGLFIEELAERHPKETIFAVCHGGVIDAAFDHIFNIGPWRRCEVWNANTGVTYFEHVEHPRRETWRLHYNNRVTHLQRLAVRD
jgi:broad specificity phosphatase PhoE